MHSAHTHLTDMLKAGLRADLKRLPYDRPPDWYRREQDEAASEGAKAERRKTRANRKSRADDDAQAQPNPFSDAMTPAVALEILGLAPGASPAEIQAAHARLIRAVHPDRGGSNYLAARVNAARDLAIRHG